jgi:hypothetical protein
MGQLGGSLSTLLGSGADVDGYMENGKFVPRTCFVKGTLVVKVKSRYRDKIVTKKDITPNREYEEKVPIETIVVGDLVLSANEKTGVLSYRKVLNTFVRTSPKVYTVKYENGETVDTTGDHPFYIQNKGFKKVEEIKLNETQPTRKGLEEYGRIYSSDKFTHIIQSISILDKETTVYNFEVEDDHTYFVTKSELWVHNAEYTIKSYNCLGNPSCDSFKVQISTNGKVENKEYIKVGEEIYRDKNNLDYDVIYQDNEGKYIRGYKDKNKNEFRANLGYLAYQGNNEVREEKFFVNNEEMTDASIISMDSKGKFNVINMSSVPNESTFFVYGANSKPADAIDYMTEINSLINNKKPVYLAYSKTNGRGSDYINIRKQLLHTSDEEVKTPVTKSEALVFDLIKNNKIKTLVTYSQGSVTALRAIKRAKVKKIEIENISLLSIAGAHNSSILSSGLNNSTTFYRIEDDNAAIWGETFLGSEVPTLSEKFSKKTKKERELGYNSIVAPPTNCDSSFIRRCAHMYLYNSNAIKEYFRRNEQ